MRAGGHTSEALSLLSALNFNRYVPRIYIISEGDTLSMQKAMVLEATKAADAPQTTPFVRLYSAHRSVRNAESKPRSRPTHSWSYLVHGVCTSPSSQPHSPQPLRLQQVFGT